MMQHLKENAVAYLCTGLLSFSGVGVVAYLDARHEPAGSIVKSELRGVRREIRKLEGYERLAPNSEYSSSRQAEIAALKDEEKELMESLD